MCVCVCVCVCVREREREREYLSYKLHLEDTLAHSLTWNTTVEPRLGVGLVLTVSVTTNTHTNNGFTSLEIIDP